MIDEQLLEDAFDKFKKLNPDIENPEEAFAKEIGNTVEQSMKEFEEMYVNTP
jgi:hypothetical protein